MSHAFVNVHEYVHKICFKCKSKKIISLGFISDHYRYGCVSCEYTWNEAEVKR